MARARARGRLRTSSAQTRTPTPAKQSDDDMDVDDQGTPQVEEEQAVEDEEGDLEPSGTPGADSDLPQIPSEPSTPPKFQNFPERKRRLGRPPKNKSTGADTPVADEERGSETGTPQKRKRGRPAGGAAAGGWRGRPRQSNVFEGNRQARIDKEGTMVDVINDEADLPEDEEGEKKVDKDGKLSGGRDYRVRVFTVKNRGSRLYMLSTEPARCCGFRDSYLFFTKHLKLHKVIVEDDEKRDLIDRGIIPHSYKGRSIGVCTARSVFREFGAKIIIGGKRIIDDYYVEQAKAMGFVEGELADPHDQLPPEGKEYNKNQYVAWHGASAVYHTGVPTVPTAGKAITGKRKINITSTNWQFEHARAASLFNSHITKTRRSNLNGIYDPHTNIMHFPKITQPTHARWEEVDEELPHKASHGLTNGVSALTNGIHDVDLNVTSVKESGGIFSPLPSIITRNFLVVDTKFESPPISGLGIPGPDGDSVDVGPNGLPDVSDDILAELPPQCRQALEAAKDQEIQWKTQWKSEVEDGARGTLRIGFLGFPV
ncbi:hypothetical protein FKW77_007615 [Venturia effusa]|uniref:Nuclear localization protein n=1 Tax=Venturia effusa TaxID=50376 RepID=A0A517LJ66_9PEZI|nr:hypothetical protein FKW77_007615 [Venturia effusa]